MLLINQSQADIFRQAALAHFEDDMLAHVKKFFPNHFRAIKETGIRNTIRYAQLQAQKNGFTSKRNVCLYLNTMLVLGSNFDTDPQYPWAAEMLHAEKITDPKNRVDQLVNKMLDTFGQIRGPRYADINRVFLYVKNNAAELFEKISNSPAGEEIVLLQFVYPKKALVVGDAALQALLQLGKIRAADYGITAPPLVLLYTVFMFLCGAGFDKDPQFAWAETTLKDVLATGQQDKMASLYRTAVKSLEDFLTGYNNNHE